MNTNTQAIPTTSSLTLVATKPRVNTSLPIVTRQIHSILIASLFVIISVLIPWGTVSAAAVKWHPGHYYAISKDGSSWYYNRVYQEIKSTPALRGAQIRYKWSDLETAKGVYDFTDIDQRLADMAAMKKRLVIVVQTKSFKPHINPAPDYLKAAKFDGGTFPYSHYRQTKLKGYNIKLWNGLVRYRLVRLMKAMGERYNSHPYFEGIGFEETAFGDPMINVSSDQVDKFYENLLMVNKNTRVHFPNTMVFQFTNYPRHMLKWFVGGLKDIGTSLGGPDVRLDDQGLSVEGKRWTPDGVYSYYPKFSGIVPLTPSVMPNNYKNTRMDGTGYKPSVQELLTYAREELKANYIFWSRTPNEYQEVLQVLNYSNQRKNPSGGLDARCPSKYSSCVK